MRTAETENVIRSPLPFKWWQVAVYAVAFLAVIRVMQTALRHVCSDLIPFDCPYYWPISTFDVRSITMRERSTDRGTSLAAITKYSPRFTIMGTHIHPVRS